MSAEHMPDERLARYYESIRRQVEADRRHKHQFTAYSSSEYVDKLRNELIKTTPKALTD
jgi:hypothetical protein